MSVQTSVQMDLAIPVKLVRSTSCNSCCSVAGVTYGVTDVVDDVDSRLEVSIVVDATSAYESDDEAVFFGDVEVIFDFFFF